MDAHMRTECSLKSVREALDEIRGLGLDMDFDSMEREIMDTFEEFYSEKTGHYRISMRVMRMKSASLNQQARLRVKKKPRTKCLP